MNIGQSSSPDKALFERETSTLTVSRVALLVLIAVATLLAAMTAEECHATLLVRRFNAPWLPSLLFGAMSWFWWVGVGTALWWVGKRSPQALRFSPLHLSQHLAGAALLALAHLALLQGLLRWSILFWPVWARGNAGYSVLTPQRVGLEVAVYACLFAFAGLLHSQAQAQMATVHGLALARQLSQAQLHALQTQMEPHFLFNTLNAVAGLVALGRNAEAGKALAHLNILLRTTLERRAPQKIPFTEELRTVESYLAIQQIRFADRLHVHIDATPEALEGLVPCFLLQPLVENAVLHGIAPLEAGGLIEATAQRIGDSLQVRISNSGGTNSGHGADTVCNTNTPRTNGHGIGLRNIRERLAFFYPDAHQFAAEAPASGGYRVTISIPYERALP